MDRPRIVIVGSRNPIAGGRELAHDFARRLAGAGLVIVSGLARGIDATAHEGALAAGGMTITVCGTGGVDRVYPAANADRAKGIADSGLRASEFSFVKLPIRNNFPRRNRVITGLGQSALVVEATRESGTLITAWLAGEFGRNVFAVLGSIHNPLARGCHQLIRNDAELVDSVNPIVDSMALRLATSDL